ncbi:MAG: IS256 family transposase, partial [Actinomycetota bacterium]
DVGSVDLDVPRDRNGDFEPKIVPKGTSRLEGFNERIIALYARGMTVRDICAHLKDLYGVEVSPDLISRVTAAVVEEIREWQMRPLDRVYAAIFLDAIVCKVRSDGVVANKAAFLAVGIDSEGNKDVLGIWIDTAEGAKFWLKICNELKTRGIEDVLFVCCDGLTGLPDAIETVWPNTIVQTCVVHLIRGTLRYVSYKDRKLVTAHLKEIYRAVSEDDALAALERFERAWGVRYPATVKLWRSSWEQFTPFLLYPPAIRRVLYTTNMIESMNFQLRKITRNRGHFPSDDALLKLLYLGVRNILADKAHNNRARAATVYGWKEALNQFEVFFPGRLGSR